MEGNKSNVFSLFQRMDEERKTKQKRSKGKDKRLTVVLSEYDFRRLSYIAREFEELPSVFARSLLLESLKDAEKFLELVEYDEKGTGYNEFLGEVIYDYTEYGEYVNGLSYEAEDEEEEEEEDKPTPRTKTIRLKAKKEDEKED